MTYNIIPGKGKRKKSRGYQRYIRYLQKHASACENVLELLRFARKNVHNANEAQTAAAAFCRGRFGFTHQEEHIGDHRKARVYIYVTEYNRRIKVFPRPRRTGAGR